MTLIEGVGDEVVEFFIGLIIVVIGVAAWWSTRIADRPLIRTVVVFERRTQNRINQQNNQTLVEHQSEQDQRNYVQDLSVTPPPETESEENKPSTAGSSVDLDRNRQGAGDSNSENSTELEEQNTIVETMDSDTNVLRQRRLDFFEHRQESSSVNSNVSETDKTSCDNTNTVDTSSRATQENSTETVENDIRIKLKYINDDLKLVNGKLLEPLGDFKRRHFEVELASNKLVRLIFNGQVLQHDELTLKSCGLFDNCVVHCLVHQKRSNPNDRPSSSSNLTRSNSSHGDNNRMIINMQSAGNQGRDWDLGNLFFAIVSFVLGAAWYFRYEYAQLYTMTATVALVCLSGIFTVLLVGMYFPDPDPPVQPVRS